MAHRCLHAIRSITNLVVRHDSRPPLLQPSGLALLFLNGVVLGRRGVQRYWMQASDFTALPPCRLAQGHQIKDASGWHTVEGAAGPETEPAISAHGWLCSRHLAMDLRLVATTWTTRCLSKIYIFKGSCLMFTPKQDPLHSGGLIPRTKCKIWCWKFNTIFKTEKETKCAMIYVFLNFSMPWNGPRNTWLF